MFGTITPQSTCASGHSQVWIHRVDVNIQHMKWSTRSPQQVFLSLYLSLARTRYLPLFLSLSLPLSLCLFLKNVLLLSVVVLHVVQHHGQHQVDASKAEKYLLKKCLTFHLLPQWLPQEVAHIFLFFASVTRMHLNAANLPGEHARC